MKNFLPFFQIKLGDKEQRFYTDFIEYCVHTFRLGNPLFEKPNHLIWGNDELNTGLSLFKQTVPQWLAHIINGNASIPYPLNQQQITDLKVFMTDIVAENNLALVMAGDALKWRDKMSYPLLAIPMVMVLGINELQQTPRLLDEEIIILGTLHTGFILAYLYQTYKDHSAEFLILKIKEMLLNMFSFLALGLSLFAVHHSPAEELLLQMTSVFGAVFFITTFVLVEGLYMMKLMQQPNFNVRVNLAAVHQWINNLNRPEHDINPSLKRGAQSLLEFFETANTPAELRGLMAQLKEKINPVQRLRPIRE